MPGRSGRDEKQTSFGAPMGVQAPVNATDRPKVGPAAPDTVHRALAAQEADASRQARAGLYQPKPAAPTENPTRDLSAANAANTVASGPARIENAINQATE